MSLLRSSDLRRAVGFLNDYCTPVEVHSYTQQVLEGLYRLIDSDQWALAEFRNLNDAAEAVVTVAPQNFALPPMKSFFAANGVQAHLNWYGSVVRALRLSDVMSRQKFHAQPVYRDFYRLIGAEDALFAHFDADGAMFIGGTRGSTVPTRDKELFDLLVGRSSTM